MRLKYVKIATLEKLKTKFIFFLNVQITVFKEMILSNAIYQYVKPTKLSIDCLFEIRKIAVCFLSLSLPGDYRVTDEALLLETT